jgi:hypothetical protein
VEGYASATSGTTHGVYGQSKSVSGIGVYGTAPNRGLEGHATATSGTTYGIYGESKSSGGRGVYGHATAASGETYGVYGRAESSGWGTAGVYGYATSTTSVTYGVVGKSDSDGGSGVLGEATTGSGTGVEGEGGRFGVHGHAWNPGGVGVFGYGQGQGVYGASSNSDGYGVYALNETSGGTALYARGAPEAGTGIYARGGAYAAVLDGRTQTEVLEITGGSDLAEPFKISGAESIVPGIVVAIDPEHPGQLRIADRAYDRTVAGCVSGANGLNPGLILEQEGTVAGGSLPVALSGRVYCWADASYGPIQPGDLLTTSDTRGHAMKVTDYTQAQGAIIGKAMSSLKGSKGLVLVLVTLQ